MYTVKFIKLNSNAKIPTKAFSTDAGFDLFSVETLDLKPQEIVGVKTGLAIQLPQNTEAQIRPRSGLALNYGITVLNTPGTVDVGYTGEIKVILINHSKEDFHISQGDRIAQLLVKPIYDVVFEQVESIEVSERGDKGFGSSKLK